jgi:polyferredoxin
MLAVPFLRWGGHSLLRVDLASRSLLAFGHTFRLEEFPLLLPLVLASLTTLLLLTLAFGRVWCGWGCPQTIWCDLVEAAARRSGARVRNGRITGNLGQQWTLHLVAASLGLLVGANVVWYFLPPGDYLSSLVAGRLPAAAAVTTLAVGFLLYLDLAFLRRTFCAEFCPYGRFQATLIDKGTLTLQLLPTAAARCIECGSCVRACPTGVDIRAGADAACINCGRCLDACSEEMRQRGEPGLIGYTWVTGEHGIRALLTPRTALVFLVAVLAWGSLFVAVGGREPLSFSVRRSPTVEPRVVAGGRFVTFFTGAVTNRTGTSLKLSLAASAGDIPLEVLGPGRQVTLAPGERTAVEFALVAPLPAVAGSLAATLAWTIDGAIHAPRAATLVLPTRGGGQGRRRISP